MHDNDRILENRINRELIERIAPAESIGRIALDVAANHLPGEPVPASEATAGAFEPIEPGAPWGRPWGTTWFHVTGEVPADHGGGSAMPEGRSHTEVLCEIGFAPGMVGFSAEAAVYTSGPDGPRLVCGVHPMRRAVPLELVSDGSRIDFYLEAAANPDFTRSFGPNPDGSRATAGSSPMHTFGGIWLSTVDSEVRALMADVSLLNEAMRVLPRGHRRRQRLAATFQRALDLLDPADVRGSAPACRSVLREGFGWHSTTDTHLVTATGHAHIDTAWLWPLRETRRKCARTFANQVELMDRFGEHRFSCSQAQQYAWVEQDHPELFERIVRRVGDGHWIPVGGMWVEADMNLPSGESIARQMIHGQRYFESRFGRRCSEVWIPDVFGYPGNLPQVFRAGGCDRFVTQKLSWNKTNRFPHHTFAWEGIDGSEVLAHFPPVETYNAEVTVRELARIESNFADHRWSDHSLMPFGHGDGGGGPTAEMLQRAAQLGSMSELPRLVIGSPSEFFERVEAEVESPQRAALPRWRGELYFEMHRGTFTSQARTKVGNRRCEEALRAAELWCATAGDDSHAERLDALWKRVLTQQFHDILPGSSIAWVHEDAEREHAEVLSELEEITTVVLAGISGAVPAVANPCSTPRREVIAATAAPPEGGPVQELADGSSAFMADVPAMAVVEAVSAPTTEHVRVEQDAPDGSIRMTNQLVDLTISVEGDITSLVHLGQGREVVPRDRCAAVLSLAPDTPVEYDAWDLEQWTAARSIPLPPAQSVKVLEPGPLVAAVVVHRSFGDSTVAETITMRSGSSRVDISLDIDWHEREKLLTIDFPLDLSTNSAACEVQFGHEYRPTHRNTTWDDAKFEVCAQRWVDYSEPSFGTAILNDGRYGHALQDGGVRVSLLRAARYPDPDADRGRHRVTLSLLPHGPGLAEVVAEAEALNNPPKALPAGTAESGRPAPAVLELDGHGVAVSAVKLADDGSGDVVVRLWSAAGDRVEAALGMPGGISAATATDLFEEPGTSSTSVLLDDGVARIELAPHQFATVRLTPVDGR